MEVFVVGVSGDCAESTLFFKQYACIVLSLQTLSLCRLMAVKRRQAEKTVFQGSSQTSDLPSKAVLPPRVMVFPSTPLNTRLGPF